MFGSNNKTITEIYEISLDDYSPVGQKSLPDAITVSIPVWFESASSETRSKDGYNFSFDAIIILFKDERIAKGNIITIGEKKYEIKLVEELSGISVFVNNRIEVFINEFFQ